MIAESYRVGRVRVEVVEGPLDTPCHVWQGCVNSKGYPSRTVDSQPVLGHRQAWEDEHGPIPTGEQIHHRCETRRCLNVEHMELHTSLSHNRTHMADSIAEAAERLLSEPARGSMRLQDIVFELGLGYDAVRLGLRRAVKAGRVERIARGQYRIARTRRGNPFTTEVDADA